MGKIKVRTIGTEEEELEKNAQKKKSGEKKLAKVAGSGADERSDGARLLDKRGAQRIPQVGPSEEKLSAPITEKIKVEPELKLKSGEAGSRSARKDKFKKTKQKHSKKYLNFAKVVENKLYKLQDALDLLEKLKRGSFDETVELHINTVSNISGNTTLPHGAGKKTRVAIASDALLMEVEKGKIEFDILLAEPSMMPKLAKVAKILGPRGLMPNPKNGTISSDPQSIAKKYEGGLLHFKSEAKAPILHVTVGKVSFGQKKLSENINTLLEAVKKENIQKAVLKSTMSPGIKLEM